MVLPAALPCQCASRHPQDLGEPALRPPVLSAALEPPLLYVPAGEPHHRAHTGDGGPNVPIGQLNAHGRHPAAAPTVAAALGACKRHTAHVPPRRRRLAAASRLPHALEADQRSTPALHARIHGNAERLPGRSWLNGELRRGGRHARCYTPEPPPPGPSDRRRCATLFLCSRGPQPPCRGGRGGWVSACTVRDSLPGAWAEAAAPPSP